MGVMVLELILFGVLGTLGNFRLALLMLRRLWATRCDFLLYLSFVLCQGDYRVGHS